MEKKNNFFFAPDNHLVRELPKTLHTPINNPIKNDLQISTMSKIHAKKLKSTIFEQFSMFLNISCIIVFTLIIFLFILINCKLGIIGYIL